MAKVIMCGGGRDRGVVIDRGVVRVLASIDPFVIDELRGLARLLDSDAPMHGVVRTVVGLLAAQIGDDIDAVEGVVFLDDAGSFTCGSDGLAIAL